MSPPLQSGLSFGMIATAREWTLTISLRQATREGQVGDLPY
jgi:hypothetical protein